MIHTMLEPGPDDRYWREVAAFVGEACDRFWIHWWFRPVNDQRPLFEQLLNPDQRPAPEPLPVRADLALGVLDPFVDTVQHSWICPNGAAAGGKLTGEVLGPLLARTAVPWWDLHLLSGGVPRELFRIL